MKSSKSISVLLADDHTILREGLRTFLESEADIEVVGEAETGRKAVELAGKLHPAVIVMDIAMPLMNGLEATRQILKKNPAAKIIILSAHSDDAYVENAMSLGASAFLLKQSSAHLLAEAIREVQKGKTFFSPDINTRRQKRKQESLERKGQPNNSTVSRLSPREAEVLQLIAEGEPNKQIASELGISIKTVEIHRSHLMQKLNIHDTAGLTRYAIQAGVIEVSVQLTLT